MSVIYVIVIILSIVLLVSLYYNFKFGMVILKLQDSIENSLEILDECYSSITQTLQTPLFFDNSEVKKVLSDISKSREAVLKVASQLASIEEVEDEDEDS